jgi:transcriptional regulator
MHPAADFRERDVTRLLDHLAVHPFATIAAACDGRLMVAHAPIVVRHPSEGVALDFHLSRHNALAGYVTQGFHCLVVSLGPEAYVSPDWYENCDQVPTWNYLSVEAEGPVTALGDAGLIALLDDLSAQEEARLAPKPPWTRKKMTPTRFETMLRGIIGARLAVQRLEGTFKLSQNKGEADRAGVAAALGDHPVGRLMRRSPP